MTVIASHGSLTWEDENVLSIPDDEQLIGFFGTQDKDSGEILSLGLVTLSDNCPTESVDPTSGLVDIGDSVAEALELAESEYKAYRSRDSKNY